MDPYETPKLWGLERKLGPDDLSLPGMFKVQGVASTKHPKHAEAQCVRGGGQSSHSTSTVPPARKL